MQPLRLNDMNGSVVIYSFLFFLGIFILIGVLSTFKSKKNNEDYFLAGRNVHPIFAGFSAVATSNSGYMFIGMIGYTYTHGLQSVWLMAGWILGDFAVSTFVHKKLRIVAEQNNILSFGGLLSRWQAGCDFKKLRVLVGIITLVFLGVYAAAQFKAGSKALYVLFGWDYSTGAIIGSIIVFLYCLAGGIRASIWTDVAQSVVMIGAMGMLCFISIQEVGGWEQYLAKLDAVSPGFLSLRPTGLALDNSIGVFLFIMGWMFSGLGTVGQPHIMVRFMAVNDPKHMTQTRVYYFLWYIAFNVVTLGVGLAARLILPESGNFDAELALPLMSQEILPAVLMGVVLAGIFSASMSTADSQILSCSAAFTRDIISKKESLLLTKATTGIVTIAALSIALFGSKNVFDLVIIAWAVLAAAFGPLLIVYALGKKVSEVTGIVMMLLGIAAALLWRQLGFEGIMYEAAPGMTVGILTWWLMSQTRWNR